MGSDTEKNQITLCQLQVGATILLYRFYPVLSVIGETDTNHQGYIQVKLCLYTEIEISYHIYMLWYFIFFLKFKHYL